MFERYTEKARRAIFFARYEASQFGSLAIGTEHLLLGLVRADRDVVARAVGAGDAVSKLNERLRGSLPSHQPVSTSVDMPLDNACKRAFAYSAEEAERLKHRTISTEHLLLGLLREKGTLAERFLTEFNADLEKLRVQFEPMEDLYFDQVRARATPAPGPHVDFVEERTGTTIAYALLPHTGAAPRKGEKIVLEFGTAREAMFRVVEVSYIFEKRVDAPGLVAHTLTKISVFVEACESRPTRPPKASGTT